MCVSPFAATPFIKMILLLAGNAPLVTPKAMPPAAPVQMAVPRPSAPDRLTISQPYAVPTTPISVSQSVGRAGIRTEMSAAKPSEICKLSITRYFSFASAFVFSYFYILIDINIFFLGMLFSDTVLQFRRKSLARFLEKCKER